jgi:hypothetical protein
MAAEKMLGAQYSTEIYFGRRQSTEHCRTGNDTVVYLWRDVSTNSTFYYNTLNNSRHENPSTMFISTLRLGPSDICTFTSQYFYKTTQLGVDVPNFLIDGSIFNSTLSKALLYFRALSLRPFVNSKIIWGLGKNDSQITLLDYKLSSWLSLIHLGDSIPKAFCNSLDWLMKTKNQKQVFLVRNGSRIILNYLPKSIKKTFDDVIIVEPDDIELLPVASNYVI